MCYVSAAVQPTRNELKKERQRLKQSVKRSNVEQQRRIDEYERLQTLRKLQSDASRTEKLLDDKASMIEERKRAAIGTKMQRDKIQVRSNDEYGRNVRG